MRLKAVHKRIVPAIHICYFKHVSDGYYGTKHSSVLLSTALKTVPQLSVEQHATLVRLWKWLTDISMWLANGLLSNIAEINPA